ncbi:hypothetical protein CDAR_441541 [Caerostris darwini]|uniref:Uncharacterized protein n=1 Tax=Caerostris darwini TaxID=1538125 RepID=A0AAV4S9Q0_9ARAC|nr:hypothetical protein CDAR_441541 [Caerostris darwini]
MEPLAINDTLVNVVVLFSTRLRTFQTQAAFSRKLSRERHTLGENEGILQAIEGHNLQNSGIQFEWCALEVVNCQSVEILICQLKVQRASWRRILRNSILNDVMMLRLRTLRCVVVPQHAYIKVMNLEMFITLEGNV